MSLLGWNLLVQSSNGNARERSEISSKLTIKTPEQCYLRGSGTFIVNTEQISHIVLMIPLLILNN